MIKFYVVHGLTFLRTFQKKFIFFMTRTVAVDRLMFAQICNRFIAFFKCFLPAPDECWNFKIVDGSSLTVVYK